MVRSGRRTIYFFFEFIMCFRVGFNEIFLISLKVLDPVSFSQLAHMFSPLMGDKNINSGISQKVFVDFLKNVSRIYQLCCFAYFTRSLCRNAIKISCIEQLGTEHFCLFLLGFVKTGFFRVKMTEFLLKSVCYN